MTDRCDLCPHQKSEHTIAGCKEAGCWCALIYGSRDARNAFGVVAEAAEVIAAKGEPGHGIHRETARRVRELASVVLPATIPAIDGVCCACGYGGPEETPCRVRADGGHCVHWWEKPKPRCGPGPNEKTW